MGIDGTELSEAISAIRAGLARAQADGQDASIRFQVREISLDLGIELRRTTSGSGGVKAFVVSADARTEKTQTQSHRLTVKLEVDGDPTVTRIADDDEWDDDVARADR
ncbi:trypco2 family protein [Streptomyces sp. SPB4]|uniref:trypco2 family protein n=1 Tax=Streptomyces sp. SPB4 TaxID=2940553 RepID=UPI002476E08F|nr:trypco2 family protein [Streptomyces sp. SPB4]MDH6544218.1 hypothetical protein [Streptomyces sp. SPB4]